jgi:hypothetical protein
LNKKPFSKGDDMWSLLCAGHIYKDFKYSEFILKSDRFYNEFEEMIFTHILCGSEIQMTYAELATNKPCPVCNPQDKLDYNYIFLYQDFWLNGFKLLEDYVNLDVQYRYLAECKECKAKYRIPVFELHKWDCLKCNNGSMWSDGFGLDIDCPRSDPLPTTHPELVKEWSKLNGIRQSFMYSKWSKEIIYWKCRRKRNHPDYPMPILSRVTYGSGCPLCNITNGEDRVMRYLDKHKIRYKTQYRYNDCKNINPLSFDFAIYKNRKIILLIEYQGEQHYRPVDLFGGLKSFEEQQRKDEIKRNYCKQNNIPLLEIPYWDFDNINKILEKELIKNGA